MTLPTLTPKKAEPKQQAVTQTRYDQWGRLRNTYFDSNPSGQQVEGAPLLSPISQRSSWSNTDEFVRWVNRGRDERGEPKLQADSSTWKVGDRLYLDEYGRPTNVQNEYSSPLYWNIDQNTFTQSSTEFPAVYAGEDQISYENKSYTKQSQEPKMDVALNWKSGDPVYYDDTKNKFVNYETSYPVYHNADNSQFTISPEKDEAGNVSSAYQLMTVPGREAPIDNLSEDILTETTYGYGVGEAPDYSKGLLYFDAERQVVTNIPTNATVPLYYNVSTGDYTVNDTGVQAQLAPGKQSSSSFWAKPIQWSSKYVQWLSNLIPDEKTRNNYLSRWQSSANQIGQYTVDGKTVQFKYTDPSLTIQQLTPTGIQPIDLYDNLSTISETLNTTAELPKGFLGAMAEQTGTTPLVTMGENLALSAFHWSATAFSKATAVIAPHADDPTGTKIARFIPAGVLAIFNPSLGVAVGGGIQLTPAQVFYDTEYNMIVDKNKAEEVNAVSPGRVIAMSAADAHTKMAQDSWAAVKAMWTATMESSNLTPGSEMVALSIQNAPSQMALFGSFTPVNPVMMTSEGIAEQISQIDTAIQNDREKYGYYSPNRTVELLGATIPISLEYIPGDLALQSADLRKEAQALAAQGDAEGAYNVLRTAIELDVQNSQFYDATHAYTWWSNEQLRNDYIDSLTFAEFQLGRPLTDHEKRMLKDAWLDPALEMAGEVAIDILNLPVIDTIASAPIEMVFKGIGKAAGSTVDWVARKPGAIGDLVRWAKTSAVRSSASALQFEVDDVLLQIARASEKMPDEKAPAYLSRAPRFADRFAENTDTFARWVERNSGNETVSEITGLLSEEIPFGLKGRNAATSYKLRNIGMENVSLDKWGDIAREAQDIYEDRLRSKLMKKYAGRGLTDQALEAIVEPMVEKGLNNARNYIPDITETFKQAYLRKNLGSNRSLQIQSFWLAALNTSIGKNKQAANALIFLGKMDNAFRRAFSWAVLQTRPAWVIRNEIDNMFRVLFFHGDALETLKSMNQPLSKIRSSSIPIPEQLGVNFLAEEVGSGTTLEKVIRGDISGKPLSIWWDSVQTEFRKLKSLYSAVDAEGKRIRKFNFVEGITSFLQLANAGTAKALTNYNSMVEFSYRYRLYEMRFRLNFSKFSSKYAVKLNSVLDSLDIDPQTKEMVRQLVKTKHKGGEILDSVRRMRSEGRAIPETFLLQFVPDIRKELKGIDEAYQDQIIQRISEAFAEWANRYRPGMEITEADVDKFFDEIIGQLKSESRQFSESSVIRPDIHEDISNVSRNADDLWADVSEEPMEPVAANVSRPEVPIQLEEIPDEPIRLELISDESGGLELIPESEMSEPPVSRATVAEQLGSTESPDEIMNGFGTLVTNADIEQVEGIEGGVRVVMSNSRPVIQMDVTALRSMDTVQLRSKLEGAFFESIGLNHMDELNRMGIGIDQFKSEISEFVDNGIRFIDNVSEERGRFYYNLLTQDVDTMRVVSGLRNDTMRLSGVGTRLGIENVEEVTREVQAIIRDATEEDPSGQIIYRLPSDHVESLNVYFDERARLNNISRDFTTRSEEARRAGDIERANLWAARNNALSEVLDGVDRVRASVRDFFLRDRPGPLGKTGTSRARAWDNYNRYAMEVQHKLNNLLSDWSQNVYTMSMENLDGLSYRKSIRSILDDAGIMLEFYGPNARVGRPGELRRIIVRSGTGRNMVITSSFAQDDFVKRLFGERFYNNTYIQNRNLAQEFFDETWSVDMTRRMNRTAQEAALETIQEMAPEVGERYSRDKFISELRGVSFNGRNLTDEEVHNIVTLNDAFARNWVSRSPGSTVADYYSRFNKIAYTDIENLDALTDSLRAGMSPENLAAIERWAGTQGISANDALHGMIYWDEQNKLNINLFRNSNPTTIVEELGSGYIDMLRALGDEKSLEEIRFIEEYLGTVMDGPILENGVWTPQAKKEFSKAFSAYFQNGNFENLPPEVMTSFERIKDWVRTVYNNVLSSGLDREITIDGKTTSVTKIFNQWFSIETPLSRMEAKVTALVRGNYRMREGVTLSDDLSSYVLSDGTRVPLTEAQREVVSGLEKEARISVKRDMLRSTIGRKGVNQISQTNVKLSEVLRQEYESMLTDLSRMGTDDAARMRLQRLTGSNDPIQVRDQLMKMIAGEYDDSVLSQKINDVALDRLMYGVNDPVTAGGVYRPAHPYILKWLGYDDEVVDIVTNEWNQLQHLNPMDSLTDAMRNRRKNSEALWDAYANREWWEGASLRTLWGDQDTRSPEALLCAIDAQLAREDLADGQKQALEFLRWEIENYQKLSRKFSNDLNLYIQPSLGNVIEPVYPNLPADPSFKTWYFETINNTTKEKRVNDFLENWKQSTKKNMSKLTPISQQQWDDLYSAAKRISADVDMMSDISMFGYQPDVKTKLEKSFGVTLSDDLSKKLIRTEVDGKAKWEWVELSTTERRALAALKQDIQNQTTFLSELAFEPGTSGIEGALPFTNRVMIDYSDFSNFDDMMKLVVPFWMFPSRSIPVWLQAMVTNPELLLFYQRYIQYSRRVAIQDGATTSDGSPLPSLEGYVPIPGLGIWFNPTSVLSFSYVIPKDKTYDETWKDKPPVSAIVNWLYDKSRILGFNPAPWFTLPLYGMGLLSQTDYPTGSVIPQINLIPKWVRKDILEKVRGVGINANGSILTPEVPWYDYMVEVQLLGKVISDMESAPSSEDKWGMVNAAVKALEEREGNVLYDQVLKDMEKSDLYKNMVGYFSGIYGKPYTDASAVLYRMRDEVNLLKMQINDDLGAEILQLDQTAKDRYEHYKNERYSLPEGFVGNLYSKLGWIRADDGGTLSEEERRKYLTISIEEDLMTRAYYDEADALYQQFQTRLKSVPVGSPSQVYNEIYDWYYSSRAEMENSDRYANVRRDWAVGYKPEQMIYEHYQNLWYKLLRETSPDWDRDGGQTYLEWQEQYANWLNNLPDYTDSLYYAMVSEFSGLIETSTDKDGNRVKPSRDQIDDMLSMGVEVSGDRVLEVSTLLQKLKDETSKDNYEQWLKSNDTEIDALNEAYKALYWNPYQQAVAGKSQWERELAEREFLTANPITYDMITQWVMDNYPDKFDINTLNSIISDTGVETIEERLVPQEESKLLTDQIWDLLMKVGPNRDDLEEAFEKLGGDTQYIYNWMNSDWTISDLDTLRDFHRRLQQAYDSLDLPEPTNNQLAEWTKVKELNDLYKSSMEEALGSNIMDIMGEYWDASSSEKKVMRKALPVIDQYYDFRESFAAKYPLWAKYYAESLYNSSSRGSSYSSGGSYSGSSSKKSSSGYRRYYGYGSSNYVKSIPAPLGNRYSLDSFYLAIAGIGRGGIAGYITPDIEEELGEDTAQAVKALDVDNTQLPSDAESNLSSLAEKDTATGEVARLVLQKNDLIKTNM